MPNSDRYYRRPASAETSRRPTLRRHHIALATSLLAIVIGWSLFGGENATASRQSVALQLPVTSTTTAISTDSTNQSVEPAPSTEPSKPQPSWNDTVVKPGDNLSILFKRAGISAATLHEILNDGHKQLTKIYPGQTLAFQLDDNGELVALKHIHDRLTSTLYQKTEQGFMSKEVVREPEIRNHYISGTIDSSLFAAADQAKLPVNLTMELANIFGGVVDFVYDIRQGDNFHVMYEELYLDGEMIGTGNILAAQFKNRGELHNAFRYEFSSGESGYYNEEGISMRKAFLRSPLDFTRVSSNFNPNRLHPVFKTKRPHRGVDYAAPRGTPVYAAGDGRITRASFTKANGHYVVIQHGEQFTTKYLHLNKRAVKANQKVKQGQIIGWVGSTGYATGPHLHYEFLVNGVHRNPRTILKKLPRAKQIANSEQPRFKQQIHGLQVQLAALNSHFSLAAADIDQEPPTL